MKKDIEIPKVKSVYMAVVNQFNETHRTHDWNVYLINDNDFALDTVLIVSLGYSSNKKTSVMRHKIDVLPAKSYAKVEFLQEDVLTLNNEFKVTFFKDNQMFDKTYIFKKNTINKQALQAIPLMGIRGVLVQ